MDPALFEKRLSRERAARAEAERLLESKSAELYGANEELRSTAGELALQSSQLNAILDNALTGIFVADAERIITRANAYAHRVFGYADGSLQGTKLTDLFAADHVEKTRAVGFEAVNLSEKAREEITGIKLTGENIPLELSVSEVYLKDEPCTLWIFEDITRRKAEEAERAQLEEELRQALKLEALGTLASGIAHEINTPVQFIGDNLHFLSDALNELLEAFDPAEKSGATEQSSAPGTAVSNGPDAGSVDVEYLKTEVPDAISQSIEGIERITEIVSAVREFSHPGSREKTNIDLRKAIESTIAISRGQWKSFAEIETSFDESASEVFCVPGEFNQVILNLIVNGAQAIGKHCGGEQGQIKVTTAATDHGIEVRISDNGGGIPEDVQPQIFDPFFTTKDVGKGTGQGLALVHAIVVKKHGGRINFQTSAGAGTTFVVFWPNQMADIPQKVA